MSSKKKVEQPTQAPQTVEPQTVEPLPAEPSTSNRTPAQEHAELVRAVEDHRFRYHVLDDPSLSDGAYDALIRRVSGMGSARR